MASSKAELKISLSLLFGVFPQVSQMIFGGGPSLSTNSTKSLSFVIRIAFWDLAASKISKSSASLSDRSRKANAVNSKVFVSQVAIAGDKCASIQTVVMLPV